MRALIIEEKDIALLLEKLELEKLKNNLTGSMKSIDEIHMLFHYEVCKWFQEQGSTYPH